MSVDFGKLLEFRREVQQLALERFGVQNPTDPDRMPNVEVKVVDRSRCWPLNFEAVPYTHSLEIENGYQDLVDDPAKARLLDQMLRITQMNLNIANEDMNRLARMMGEWFRRDTHRDL